MAKKKKKVINLSDQNISYIEKERHIKIISINPNNMDVEVSISVEGEKKKIHDASACPASKRDQKTGTTYLNTFVI
jgi:hypothetical protein